MKKIDISTWDRKEHYLFFSNSDYGHYNIGTDIDITNFRKKTKEQGFAFSFAMTYAVMMTMNKMEVFRYRKHNGDVVLHECIHPSFTYLAENMKYFKFVTVDLEDTIEKFIVKAQDKAIHQKEYFPSSDMKDRTDLVFISNIPKVSFTHLSHTMSFNKEDTFPRLSWGKFYNRDNKIFLPLNIEVHHAFVDGNHVGDYIESLQEYFDIY